LVSFAVVGRRLDINFDSSLGGQASSPTSYAIGSVGAKGFYFDAFQVDEPQGQRWAAALELLADGRAIVYRRIGLSLSAPGLVVVEVPAWVDVDGMPEGVAMAALSDGEATVLELAQGDAAFASLALDRVIEIRLVDESYGWVYATRRDGATAFTESWSRRHPARS
jgi:hypothetical protein